MRIEIEIMPEREKARDLTLGVENVAGGLIEVSLNGKRILLLAPSEALRFSRAFAAVQLEAREAGIL